MRVICLDTNILIWGIRKEITEEEKNKILKTRHFLEQIKTEKVIIPSIVCAELLMKVPPEEHSLVTSKFNGFMIIPVDSNVASIFAQLWYQENYRLQDGNSLHGSYEMTKHELKADLFILATAMSQDCDELYTDDKKFSKLAGKHLLVRSIPSIEIKQEFDFE